MESIFDKLAKLVKEDKSVKVKFIRLGRGSCNADYCIKNKKITFGFSSDKNLIFWNSLKNQRILDEEIKTELKKQGENVSVGFRQCKDFFNDDGDVLWITSFNTALHFGFSDGANAYTSLDNVTQKSMQFGWLSKDLKGNQLLISGLNGGITKTLSYQGTICDFSEVYAKLLINRILCIPNPRRVETEKAYNDLIERSKPLIQAFTPKDFELLVELIISRAGLKRMGVAGKNEETIDLVLNNPITDERWIVQVKSDTNQNEFEKYLKAYIEISQNVEKCRMIYAFHTGKVKNADKNVLLWDINKLSKLVVDNGLVDWVLSVAPV